MTSPVSYDAFWNFSVTHYSKPGVAAACLALQDRHGLDVNMVLFCVWYGRHFGTLSSSQTDAAIDFSENWSDHVVKPLRGVRRWLKVPDQQAGVNPGDLETYRTKVKRLELEAERLQQHRLQALIVDIGKNEKNGNQAAVTDNVQRYLANCGVEPDDGIDQLLSAVTVD